MFNLSVYTVNGAMDSSSLDDSLSVKLERGDKRQPLAMYD